MNEYVEFNHKLEKLYVAKRTAMYGLISESPKKLYFGQMPILRYIMKHNGCTQAELAEHLGVSPASIATSTKRMQNAGLLEKRDDANNLRRKNLYITGDGIENYTYFKKVFDAFDKKVYDGISKKELDVFSRVVDKMTMNITGESENTILPGDMFKLNPEAKPLKHSKQSEQSLEQEGKRC